jgi:hypothetical protein
VASLTPEEAEDIAERASYKTSVQVLKTLGINIEDGEQLARWQENMGFLDRMHGGAKTITKTAIKAGVGSLVAGLIAVVWIGFKVKIGS